MLRLPADTAVVVACAVPFRTVPVPSAVVEFNQNVTVPVGVPPYAGRTFEVMVMLWPYVVE
jgi:hypothetical protein